MGSNEHRAGPRFDLTALQVTTNGGWEANTTPDFASAISSLGIQARQLRVEGTTPYAKFLKGEIPIWIGYENDGLKAKYLDGMKDSIDVIIPKEGSAAAPYGMSLVKNAPNPSAGKLWLNFVMSPKGQQLFAEGFVRPSVPDVKLPASVSDKMPAAPQIKPLDVIKAQAHKAQIDAAWSKAALSR